LNSISKSSQDGAEGYKDFSCTDQTTLTEGQSYNINIQTNPSLAQDTKVWIDFNNDGAFTQANELMLTQLNTINPTGSITIPMGVATLNTLLRMRVSSDGAGSNPGSCTALIQGQAEDYGVKIIAFVSTNELQVADYRVQIFPNPFSESAVLAVLSPLQRGIKGDFVFQLYDLVGQKVKEQSIVSNQTTIERGTLQPGVYFYKLILSNATIATGKIMIE
jgi:hypothetical protein